MTEHVQAAFGVSEFIAVLNQTLEFAYPYVEVEGELSNFRVSKNKWVYFDLKDASASLKCFATIYTLPGPLEDGMVVRVAGSPRLHPLYNFSFQAQAIVPVGQGNLRRAADLLAAKLASEGLFDENRKRPVPYPPVSLALITAGDSAAYADFMKILGARWVGMQITHYNVLVQGDQAPGEIIAALKTVSEDPQPPDAVVLIRGGGSADDLATWSDERVVRAVAGSRVPTVVAIGHEVDTSLAELAADVRASTPSNAAELLVPDRKASLRWLSNMTAYFDQALAGIVTERQRALKRASSALDEALQDIYTRAFRHAETARQLLVAYDPKRPLGQGYALVYHDNAVITKTHQLSDGDTIEVKLSDGTVVSIVKSVAKGDGTWQ